MILRALGLEERAAATTCNQPHKDVSQVSAWAGGYVTLAWQMGLMQGVSADYFNPQGGSTKAQAAVVVLRAMELMVQITTRVTFKGTVVVSEVEGQHFELKLAAGDGGTQYVLEPASEYMQKQLAAAVGQETSVTGTFKAGVDSFMRGPILLVLMVGEQFKLPSG
ncbi:MAG: S-layer homology domain-containing protein [Bacillota bacterium]